jgi:hypothetical protein
MTLQWFPIAYNISASQHPRVCTCMLHQNLALRGSGSLMRYRTQVEKYVSNDTRSLCAERRSVGSAMGSAGAPDMAENFWVHKLLQAHHDLFSDPSDSRCTGLEQVCYYYCVCGTQNVWNSDCACA